jgi:hypothetical protein
VELGQSYQGFGGVINIKLLGTIDHLCTRATPLALVYWHANYNLNEVQALSSVQFEFEPTDAQ